MRYYWIEKVFAKKAHQKVIGGILFRKEKIALATYHYSLSNRGGLFPALMVVILLPKEEERKVKTPKPLETVVVT